MRTPLLGFLALAACSGTAREANPGSVNEAAPRPGNMSMTQERAPPILTYRLEERGLVDAAGADGRLMLHNGCLAVQWSGGTNLLVFREGTATWDSAASALRYRDRIFRVGAAIRVSGSPTGGIGVVPPSREAIARCGGGPIWIVANLESGG